jgi:hypothetical protein
MSPGKSVRARVAGEQQIQLNGLNLWSLVSIAMHLNPSTNKKKGHFSQGRNHYCYIWLQCDTQQAIGWHTNPKHEKKTEQRITTHRYKQRSGYIPRFRGPKAGNGVASTDWGKIPINQISLPKKWKRAFSAKWMKITARYRFKHRIYHASSLKLLFQAEVSTRIEYTIHRIAWLRPGWALVAVSSVG